MPVLWLGLQSLALWPHWVWNWRRLGDGSDDPLGVVALIALTLLVARLVRRLRSEPDLHWIAAAAALTVGSAAATLFLPPLLAALFAVLALAAGIIAWLPRDTARLLFVGLAVLALPLLSSLQFYAGYPLRLVTAELSSVLLRAIGMEAGRSGAAMLVAGRLVIVDAPCSGVQMAWLAYFTAFVGAALGGVDDRAFLRRLPWVGVLVLLGNAVRNAVLVALEARQRSPGEVVHQGVGLVLLAAVCVLVLRVLRGGMPHARAA